MPRLLTASEVLVSLRTAALTAFVYRPATGTHGSTTTTTAPVAGDTDLDVAAVTNFTDLDPIIIRGTGGDELNAINDGGAPVDPIITLRPIVVAQAIGATVEEAVGLALGHISPAGITTTGSLPKTPVQAATSATPLTFITGAGEFSLSMGLMGYNVLNWQFALGVPESEIGSGTVALPYQGHMSGDTVGTQGFQVVRVQGVRDDGQIVEVDFYNAQAEVTGGPTFNRGADNAIPVTLKYTSSILRHWAPA